MIQDQSALQNPESIRAENLRRLRIRMAWMFAIPCVLPLAALGFPAWRFLYPWSLAIDALCVVLGLVLPDWIARRRPDLAGHVRQDARLSALAAEMGLALGAPPRPVLITDSFPIVAKIPRRAIVLSQEDENRFNDDELRYILAHQFVIEEECFSPFPAAKVAIFGLLALAGIGLAIARPDLNPLLLFALIGLPLAVAGVLASRHGGQLPSEEHIFTRVLAATQNLEAALAVVDKQQLDQSDMERYRRLRAQLVAAGSHLGLSASNI